MAIIAGITVVYAGAHGTGPFGDIVRAAMAAEHVEVLSPPARGQDTGVSIALVDADAALQRGQATAPIGTPRRVADVVGQAGALAP